jgi:hypothetical protein
MVQHYIALTLVKLNLVLIIGQYTLIYRLLYKFELCSYDSEKSFRNGHHPRPLIESKLGLPWGTP